MLCLFEKNNWSAEEKRNSEGRGGKYLVHREEEEGTRVKEYEENIWMRKTFCPRGKRSMEKENL